VPAYRPPRGLLCSAMVALVLAGLSGCGNSAEVTESAPQSSAPNPTTAAATPTPTTTSPAASNTPEIRVIEVQIVDGSVRTEADRVEVASGESVRLVVTSDVDDELHVHGVDQTAVLVAGEPTTIEFTAGEPGVYEVETHDGGQLLFQLLVR
jgi:plastocyanin